MTLSPIFTCLFMHIHLMDNIYVHLHAYITHRLLNVFSHIMVSRFRSTWRIPASFRNPSWFSSAQSRKEIKAEKRKEIVFLVIYIIKVSEVASFICHSSPTPWRSSKWISFGVAKLFIFVFLENEESQIRVRYDRKKWMEICFFLVNFLTIFKILLIYE